MGAILDGKGLSEKIIAQVALEVANLKAQGILPKLCVILVGENPASVSYVNMKKKACERTGIESQIIKFDEFIAQKSLLDEIARLNTDKSVSGILVQLPLPKHIDTGAILEAIEAKKDVDGFHPYNIGRLVAQTQSNSSLTRPSRELEKFSFDRRLALSQSNFSAQPTNLTQDTRIANDSNDSSLRGSGEATTKQSIQNNTKNPILAPATPLGIMWLLKAYDIAVSGKNVAIIGASNIVGKPLSALMLNVGATISVCHILTKDISVFTKSADIVCVGVGKVNLITANMIKDGAIVIDIGINKVDGKIKGDVDFKSVAKKASFITPVPGGVGPMTIAMLLKNTILCAQILHESSANPTAKDKNELP
ncbi:bifunctional 5,10-methylenetetrahydrofolate dehydrogenase/5,10-methenyltetrahydrofolate cyclohydrolase [Helicobacter sp. 23-1045]